MNYKKLKKAELIQKLEEMEKKLAVLQRSDKMLKKTEEVMHRSEKVLQSLIENSLDTITLLSDNGTILYENSINKIVLGYKGDELIGRNLLEFVHPEDKSKTENLLKQTIANPTQPFSEEIRVKGKNGSWIILDTKCKGLFEDGEINGIVVNSRNITERKKAEENLKETQRKLSTLLDNLPGMAYRFKNDKFWTAEFLSEGVLELTGYHPADFIQNRKVNYTDLVLKEDRKAFTNEKKEAAKHKKTYKGIYRIKTKSGKIKWVWEQGIGIPNEHNSITAFEGFATDITNLKQAEKKLKESEERYRHLYNNAQVGLYRTKIDDGTLLECNHRFAEMFGYTDRNEFIQNHNVYESYVDQNKRKDLVRKLEKFGKVEKFESKFKRKDNTVFWGRFTANVNKKKKYIEGVITDVTDEKKALKALQKSEERYRLVADNVSDVIWTVDKNYNFTYISPSITKMLGYTPEEAFSKNISGIFTQNDFPTVKKAMEDEFAKESEGYKESFRSITLEVQHIHKQGIPIWAEVRISVLHDYNKNPIGILGASRDIVQRKRAEITAKLQQQQLIQADKMASLGILVSGVAHEINNPNNFISLNAKIFMKVWNDIHPILQEYYLNQGDFPVAGMPYTKAHNKIEELISGISEGSVRIKKIVNSLKDFARRDKGDLDQILDVNSVIDSSIVIVNNLIKKSISCFSVNIQKNLPKIKGNFQQLEQVIINLITNSCHAVKSKENAQSLTISAELDKTNNQIIIKTADDGVGIPKENLSHILDPFFTTKRDTGGTGLGLSVSYNIIKNHGGELKFISETGKGTEAVIYLPVSS